MAEVQTVRIVFDVDGRAIRQVQGDLRDTEKQAGGLEGAVSRIGPRIAAAFSVAAIGAFLKKSVELSAAFEQNVISIEQFVGSTDKAKKLLKELEQFAAKTPFEFPEIAESAKRLLAFGVGANKITDTLRRLGDIAAGTGKPLGEISLIYGQVLAKGKLQGEELLQFAEKGVPLLQAVADVLGKSTQETQALITKGQVGFPVVEQAIRKMTDAGGKFAGLTEKQSKSLGGLLSTLSDSFSQLTRQIGDELAPVMKVFIDFAIQGFDRWSEAMEKSNKQLEGTSKGVQFLVKPFLNLVNAATGVAHSLNSWLSVSGKVPEILAVATEQSNALATAFGANNIELGEFSAWLSENTEGLFKIQQAAEKAGVEWIEGRGILGGKWIERLKGNAKTQTIINDLFNEWKGSAAATAAELNGTTIPTLGNLSKSAKEVESAFEKASSSLGKFNFAVRSLDYLRNVVSNLEEVANKSNVGGDRWTEYTRKLKEAREELEFFTARAKLLSGETPIAEVAPLTQARDTEGPKRTGEEAGVAFKDGFNMGMGGIEKDMEEEMKKFLNDIGPAVSQTVSIINEIFAIQSELIDRNLEKELSAIETKKSAEIQAAKGNRIEIAKIEKKFNAEKMAAERKAANQRKGIAIAEAVINGAVGITKVLSQFGLPLGPIFAIAMAGLTAAQIALISSQQFAKGVIDLDGPGTGTSDSIPARLSKGESVMTARETKQWKPLLTAIRNKDVIPGPMGLPMFKDGRGPVSVTANLSDDRMVKELRMLRSAITNTTHTEHRTSDFSYKKRLPNGRF